MTVPYGCTMSPDDILGTVVMMWILGIVMGAGIVAWAKDGRR